MCVEAPCKMESTLQTHEALGLLLSRKGQDKSSKRMVTKKADKRSKELPWDI
jgi:hypothetical protein